MGISDASMDLIIAEDDILYLPLSGSRFVLIGRDRPDETGHYGFEIQEGRSARFSVPVPATELISLLVCPALHIYVHHLMAETRNLQSCFA